MDTLKFSADHANSMISGAGYDQIDVQACTSRSISVSNTPSAVDDATADLAMFLIVGALRNFNAGMTSLRRGEWRGLVPSGTEDELPPLPLGHDPQSKLLGIIGMGGIGKEIAKRAVVFGMKIAYYNRNRLPEQEEKACGDATYMDFDTVLAKSDVLSLNLPLNVSNIFQYLLCLRADAVMKPSNTCSESHQAHHLNKRVYQNEDWCNHHQHCSWCCDGRSSPCCCTSKW